MGKDGRLEGPSPLLQEALDMLRKSAGQDLCKPGLTPDDLRPRKKRRCDIADPVADTSGEAVKSLAMPFFELPPAQSS